MPLQPNVIERQLIRHGVVPGLLIDLGMASFQASAMIAALETGLFEEINDQPLDVETLAKRLDASPEGVGNLVEVLVGLGYLESKNGRYALTGAAKRSLPVEHLCEMAPFFKEQTIVNIENATRAVKEAPEDGVVGWERVQSGTVGRAYQTSMRWLASGTVGEVVKKVELPEGARRMLDVGGSHGLYTVEFCRKYPALRGTVLDWPIGLEAAEETLREATDVADRIDLCECDFEREDLPTGYDFAFLGNIIHGISSQENRELFGKLADSTTDRGTVAILDQFAGVSGSRFAKTVAALVGFNLFLFSGGRSYPYEEVKRWLSEAGFTEVSHKKTRQPGFSLIVARKTGAS